MNSITIATCLVFAIAGPLLAADGRLDASPLSFTGPRATATTPRADFANASFQAEITVTLKSGTGGNGCAFFGLGSGEPDAANYQEPTKSPSLAFRLAPSDFAGGQVVASIDGAPAGDANVLGDGTHRLRLSWDAAKHRAWLEIHPNWKDGASFAAARLIFLDKVSAPFGREGKLFAGGGGGVAFRDFAVRPLTARDLAALPVTDSFSNDPSARTWLPVRSGGFLQSLRQGGKVTVVSMGTSLTGGTWRWPDVMMNEWLNTDFPGQVTFFNEAVGGSASSVGPGNNPALSGLGKLPAVIAHKPDVVFIEFATNDAYLPYHISLDDSKRNLNRIIDSLLAANPRMEIILQTMNSVKDLAGSGNHATDRPQLAEYAQGYRDVAKERGLLLVDHYPAWLKVMNEDPARFDRLVPDRIHPQAEGYREIVLPELRKALAGSQAAGSSVEPVDSFLKDLQIQFRPLVCWYSGAALQASRTAPGGKLELPGSSWKSSVEVTPVAGQPDARDLTLSFTVEKGGSLSSGIAAAFDFSEWSTDNYVLVPGAVYNGNRLRTVGRGYAAGLDPADYYRKDLPLTQTDVPRLQIEADKPSKLEVNSSNVTTPAIAVLDRKAKRGFIVLSEQGGRTGDGDFLRRANGEIIDNAFAVEESADRKRAAVVISAPGVRERKPEFIGFSGSPDRGIPLKAGDTVRLKLRVISFAAPDVPDLLEKFMTVRKGLTGANHPRKLVPASQVETWMTQRIDSRFLTKDDMGFYCPENGPWIAFGWIGGWMNTFPMLVQGDAQHLERVNKTFDWGLKAQMPSGYFHYAIDANGNTTFRDPAPDSNMARTSGDMLFWMMKQFLLLKAQGRANAIKPEWEASMKRLADGMVATWKKHGEWGKLINVKTGDVTEYNTTGGAMIIGGLALASGYFDQPVYLQTATEAADFYYQRDFVNRGFTTGACADILQNAESETAAGLMTALMALHETTGELRWLEMSRNVANLVATWTVSHDYQLPKTTELGQLDAHLAGVYWASTQNKHGAPGICTSSGDPLFKIYRTTGDTRYAELQHDIIAAHGESIRPGGFTNERLTFCDADSRGSRGDHVTGWNETNGILMAQEVPGVYLRTDIDRCFVFDAIDAKVVSRNANGVELELTNPTQHDARVSILAENAGQAAKPLGYTALIRWPKVEVKAGASKRVTVTADGKLN